MALLFLLYQEWPQTVKPYSPESLSSLLREATHSATIQEYFFLIPSLVKLTRPGLPAYNEYIIRIRKGWSP